MTLVPYTVTGSILIQILTTVTRHLILPRQWAINWVLCLNLGSQVCQQGGMETPIIHSMSQKYTRVNQKVKAIFKLRGNQDREELAHCAVLTMPVEEFSHLQYSALPSVVWQQRGQKHGRSFARLLH